jgi:apolipoprotein N-acyltransferase
MTQTVLRIIAWSLFLLVALATLSPIGVRPNLPLEVDAERALAFAALGFAFAVAYPRHLWAGAAIVVIGAFGLELLQLLRPDRHGRVFDAVVKTSAACIGLGLGWLTLSLWNRRSK